ARSRSESSGGVRSVLSRRTLTVELESTTPAIRSRSEHARVRQGLLNLLDPPLVDLGAVEAQRFELGERFQEGDGGVRDARASQVEPPQPGQVLQVYQAATADRLVAVELQLFEAFQLFEVDQGRVRQSLITQVQPDELGQSLEVSRPS